MKGETDMVFYADGTGVMLSGRWDLSGVVLQIESLSRLHHLESGLDKNFRIDCSEISSVDLSGLQLLYVWIQCVRLRGAEPALVNLPEGMKRRIRQLGLEGCFADFSADAFREADRDGRMACGSGMARSGTADGEKGLPDFLAVAMGEPGHPCQGMSRTC